MNHILSNIRNNRVNVVQWIIAAAILILFVAFTRTEFLSDTSKQWLTDIAWMTFSFLAGLTCYQVSVHRTGRLKQAWRYFAYAHVSWFMGIVVWSYLELIAKQATPFPALSDIGFMLFPLLFLVGLSYLRSEEIYYRNTLIQMVKLALIITCLVILHIYLLDTPLNESKEGWLYVSTALAYPVLYMTVMIYGLLSLTQLHTKVSISLYLLVSMSLFVHAVTDSLYAYSLLGKTYQVGNYLDVFWLLAFAIMILVARQAKNRIPESVSRQQFVFASYLHSLFVPALLFTVLVVMISNTGVWQQDNAKVYLYSVSVLIAMVMIYQVAVAKIEKTLMDNLSTSELLLKKTNSELMHMATTSGAKLEDEIRKHKATGEQLEQHHILLDIIKKVQDEFIGGVDRHVFFEHLLSSILEVTKSKYGFVGEVLYKDNAPFLKTFALTNISWDEETRQFYDKYASEGMEFHNMDTLFGHVLINQQVVISNDPQNDVRKGTLPEGHPALNAFLGIPLIAKNEMIGMVGVANREGGYTDELLERWQPFFRTCANLVQANKVENERKQVEEHLLIAKNEAEKANLAKSEFMSRMSHELRTPLNAVIGFAQLMKLDESLDGEHQESAEEINKAGKHLLGLINDLLDVSRIETNQLEYHFEKLSVRKIIADAIKYSSELAKDKDVSVRLHVNQDCEVNADEIRLRQVFINLMTNAIKYNKQAGEVNISVEANDDGYCHILVSDEGIGIATDKLPRLFSPFDRLDVEKYAVDGIGIGLYITKQIIERHKGEIDVESQEHKGSVFKVKIPLYQ